MLHLLAGGDGDHETWTREYRVHENPALRDTLVVMPEMPSTASTPTGGTTAAAGPRPSRASTCARCCR
ncbi:hypothetical protein ACFQ60_05655 [Streptomyces zhihengii]